MLFPRASSALALCLGAVAAAAALPQGGSGSGSDALLRARSPSTTLSSLGPARTPTAHAATGVACNNSPDLCGRAYNNVTYM